MRALAIACAIWALALPAAAWAQVAAPAFNPFTIRESGNPAVQQWRPDSFVGAGLADGTLDQPTQTADISGKFAQLTLVGERLSFGLSWLSNDLTVPEGSAQQTFAAASVAGRLADWLSLGVGLEKGEFDTAAQEDEASLPIAGASVRLGESFYLGAALGKEKRTVTQFGPPASVDASRSVTRLGLGALWRSDVSALHLEAYREERKDYDFPLPVGSRDGFRANWLVAEANMRGVLLGVASAKETDVSGSNPRDKRVTRLVVGWAPRAGFTVAYLGIREKTEDSLGAFVEEVKVNAVGLGWSF
ncbi:MAG TPA: hypothetical protein VGC20_00555 [bacterium]